MIVFLLMLSLLLAAPASADDATASATSCDFSQHPAFPAPGQPPVIETWNQSNMASAPTGLACAANAKNDFTGMTAITGSMTAKDGAQGILTRFGTISGMQGVKYWSMTDGAWKILILKASAVDSAKSPQHRDDFTAGELAKPGSYYFVLNDNRFSGPVTYRYRVLTSTGDKLVIEEDNVSSATYMKFATFNPEDLRAVYVLEKQSDDAWGYYSLSSAHEHGFTTLGGDHKNSYINRAVAMYRHIAGIPTDQEPPAVK